MNRSLQLEDLHPDCRYFRGDIPCNPHKRFGVHCVDCSHYEPTEGKILIIKLGAIGDVIRSTPLLHRLKKEYPRALIYWITRIPELIPSVVDRAFSYSIADVTILRQISFDLLINLDKDVEACALANSIPAHTRMGFLLKEGRPWPVDEKASKKFFTGLFDDLSKANQKSYLQELFAICGYEFQGERYILDLPPEPFAWPEKKASAVVGLNTGCGGRWQSRMWPEKNWVELARRLRQKGLQVLLLGGEEEHEKNQRIARATGATYLGHFPIKQFIAEMNHCDLVVTAVTMAMHLAIGLKKKLVLFNNTFNRHEFELYGLGEILEPEFDCDCYYARECPNNCMQYIYVDRVVAACERVLSAANSTPKT